MWLARHGQTEWNRDGRKQGRQGGPLTETGRAQARALAEAARRLGVRRVVASPLPRALETATAIGLPVETCAALVEMDHGACNGMTDAEIAARFPVLRAERARDRWHHRWPGGESYADVAARLASALPALAGEDTMVVAHQALNRVLAHLAGPASREAVLATAQRSDVLFRLGDGAAPAWATTGELVWRDGLGD